MALRLENNSLYFYIIYLHFVQWWAGIDASVASSAYNTHDQWLFLLILFFKYDHTHDGLRYISQDYYSSLSAPKLLLMLVLLLLIKKILGSSQRLSASKTFKSLLLIPFSCLLLSPLATTMSFSVNCSLKGKLSLWKDFCRHLIISNVQCKPLPCLFTLLLLCFGLKDV